MADEQTPYWTLPDHTALVDSNHQSQASSDPLFDRFLADDEEVVGERLVSIYVNPKDRPFRDVVFVAVYLFAMVAFVIVGALAVFDKVDELAYVKSLFAPLWSHVWLLVGLLCASVIASLGWLYLLSRFSKVYIHPYIYLSSCTILNIIHNWFCDV